MIDPVDDKTASLDLAGVTDISEARAEARLAKEFDLVRVRAPVYVLDSKAAAVRSAGAERVAKHREKAEALGLKPATVPVALLAAVKAAGGWSEWEKAAKPAPVVQVVDRVVDRIVEIKVAKPLSQADTVSIDLGRRVQKLSGWRSKFVSWLL